VPKVSTPASPNDYRPISVTPILSRIAEKYIAKHYIRPVIPGDAILDQFAFKPSGSTLVCLQDHVTYLLETNFYVRCFITDFSKAFGTAEDLILVSKFSNFALPADILNWIIDFLTDRQQLCKLGSVLSHPVSISRGIIQGSGLGPTLYIRMKSDSKALCTDNVFIKFADDADLLVPENSKVDVTDDFLHIKKWAVKNKLVLNLAKRKEIVLYRLNPKIVFILLQWTRSNS